MGLLERVKDMFHTEHDSGQGIGNTATGPKRSGRFDDDDATSRLTIIIRSLQIFFLLIGLFIAIALASFQRSNGVGPSGLTGLDLFIIIQALLVTSMFVVVPVLHERKGWMSASQCRLRSELTRAERIAQIIRQIRFGLISHVAECSLLLILAIANSISSNTAGCKNPDDDPSASLEGYKCVERRR